jgi:heavy metal sensor kinase
MALLFVGVGFGLYRVVEHNLYNSTDAALMTAAKSIRDARFVRGFSPPLMEGFLQQFFGGRYVRPYAQLVDLSGNISAKTDQRVSLPVTPKAWERAKRGRETKETVMGRRSKVASSLDVMDVDTSETPIRMITLPVIRYGKFTGELVQVGTPLQSAMMTMRELAWVLWVSLPAGLCLSILFGYLLTKRAFHPVKVITSAAANMGSSDLGVRLPLPAAKDELQTLAKTFNELMDRLEDAFKRLRRFNGDVSHELRTPLAVLRGEAELALRRERSPEEYKQALRTIAGEAGNMTVIIEDLLLLARAESRSLAMSWAPIQVKEFIGEVAAQVQSHFETRKVTLNIHNEVEGGFEGQIGFLSLAIKNILINAAKHSGNGTEVDFTVHRDGSDMIFTIKDQGEGIPKESQSYIFDPFYRADTARNRAAGGTGIGLSLAMALVRLHRGNITVTSEPGEGACFTVRIPRAPEDGDRDLESNHALLAKTKRPAVSGPVTQPSMALTNS